MRPYVIGGIAYRRQPLAAGDVEVLSSVLTEWIRTPAASLAGLRGTVRVADQTVVYPPDETMVEPTSDIVRLLTSALSSAAQAGSAHADPRAAMLMLASIAKMPDRRFVPALEGLRDLPRIPRWSDVAAVVDGLRDELDPSRTPVGDER